MVKSRKSVGVFVAIVITLSVSHQAVGGEEFYRYIDNKGILVLEKSIPPQYVPKGYDIIDEYGRILKVIPAALSKEEYAKLKVEERQKKKQLIEDQRILKLYKSIGEASRSRIRKLDAIDGAMGIAKSNSARAQQLMAAEQNRAADIELSGQAVPEAMYRKIESLRDQIKAFDAEYAQKDNEKIKVAKEFDAIVERMRFFGMKES